MSAIVGGSGEEDSLPIAKDLRSFLDFHFFAKHTVISIAVSLEEI